tara:strand:+ start:146 stop:337 length:192 start_codon:yes stop_codon:yes gene_type:complete
LAPFLALVLAAIYLDVDISNLACWWLVLRVVHGLIYLVGIPYLRTLAYIGSVVCLIMMGVALV